MGLTEDGKRAGERSENNIQSKFKAKVIKEMLKKKRQWAVDH